MDWKNDQIHRCREGDANWGGAVALHSLIKKNKKFKKNLNKNESYFYCSQLLANHLFFFFHII